MSTTHVRISGHHRSIKHHRGRSSFTCEEKRIRYYSLQSRLPRYASEMRCASVCLSLHMQIEPTCRIWNIFRARVAQTSPSPCPEQASRQAEHVQTNPPSFQYTPSTFLALLLPLCCERKRPAVQQAPRTILHTMRMIMKSQTCKTSPSPFGLERWRRVEEVALHPSATIDSQPNSSRFSYSSRWWKQRPHMRPTQDSPKASPQQHRCDRRVGVIVKPASCTPQCMMLSDTAP